MSSPGGGQLTCRFCTRRFSRREHLARHLGSHDNRRPYQCGACGKAFNRCDLLTRHRRLSCMTVIRNRPKDPQSRTRSACDSCVKAKLRCSSSVPCNRCQQKGIPCVGKSQNRSTDPAEADDVFPASAPLAQSALIQEQKYPHNAADGVLQDLSAFPRPQTAIVAENSETEPPRHEMQDTHDEHSPIFDWSLQNCTPPQGLSMDFLDLSTFPVNAFQIDPHSMSGMFGATAGPMNEDALGNDSLRPGQHATGHVVPDLSDSWHTYSGCGMVQADLWNKIPPPESIEPEHNPSRAENALAGSQERPRSILNLLSLEDILAMEDHGHVAQVRLADVEELSSFVAKEGDLRTWVRYPHCRALLNNPQVINAFVQLYFEHFHPTLPLLHRATFTPSEGPPLLTLAVATIGSRFSKIPQAHTLSTAMGEVLRKAVDNLLEENIHQTIEIPFAQAAVLNQIQTAYNGSRHLALKAQFQRSMLVTLCRGLNSKMRRRDTLRNLREGASSQETVATRWLDRELGRRLIYGIWFIDCQFSLNASVSPMMTLEDLDSCLPCHESQWDLDLPNLSEVSQSSHDRIRAVRLKDALNISKLGYIVRSQDLGLFARSILMMAVFYQWHTATSVNRYLLQGADEHIGQYLALDPLVEDELLAPGRDVITPRPLVPAAHHAQWKTAASEAITLICRNPSISRDSDSSQLLKLYHHISILLVVPLQPMCDYIRWMSTKDCAMEAREKLCAWLRADLQNARRIVIHAVALFCLIRKRKSGAHGENHHLFVAFLTIWIFFSLHPIARPSGGPDEGPYSAPVCYIDWDGQIGSDAEEMWIHARGNPGLRIAGVGNLEEPSGIHRILVETHRLLLSDQMWGISRLFAGVLEGLVARGAA